MWAKKSSFRRTTISAAESKRIDSAVHQGNAFGGNSVLNQCIAYGLGDRHVSVDRAQSAAQPRLSGSGGETKIVAESRLVSVQVG
jgi:hypothetical protein